MQHLIRVRDSDKKPKNIPQQRKMLRNIFSRQSNVACRCCLPGDGRSLILFKTQGITWFIHMRKKVCTCLMLATSLLEFADISKQQMEIWKKSRQPRTLRDLHGVRLVHRASFQEELPLKGGIQLSSDANSEIPGDDRRLLMEFEDDDNFKDSGAASPYIHLRRIWQMRGASLRPAQCNHLGDQSLAETIANVLTSLPFIFLGIQAPRKRMRNVVYANSLIGVGVASSLYHTSRGDARKYFRWADYAMIATTTICLTTALRKDNPKTLIMASAMMLPFQPFLVSAIHTGIMELDFAKRVVSEPELRMAYNLHTASSVVGAALYVADDMFPQTPYLHAGWHLAAAVGVATCNKLLK